MRAEDLRIRHDELTARLRAVEDAIEQARNMASASDNTSTDRIVSSEIEGLQDQRQQLTREIDGLGMPDAPRG